MGIFEHVWAAKFPTDHRRTHLVLRVRGRRTEIGVHQLRIRFVDDQGAVLLGSEGTVRFGEPPAGDVSPSVLQPRWRFPHVVGAELGQTQVS